MYTIYHQFFIKAFPEKVFLSIANPQHLENWWPKSCKGDLQLNGQYNFYFNNEFDWYGKVSTFEPNKTFAIIMTDADDDWNETTIMFKLCPFEKGVIINFEHSGWKACNDHFKISSFCWAILLKGLKEYIEEDKIIPFNERE